MITSSDIVTFILQNRRNDVYKGVSPWEIKADVERRMLRGGLMFVLSEDKIKGVVMGEVTSLEKKHIRIANALFVADLTRFESRSVWKAFVAQFHLIYGLGWTFTFNRFKTKDVERHMCAKKLGIKLGLNIA